MQSLETALKLRQPLRDKDQENMTTVATILSRIVDEINEKIGKHGESTGICTHSSERCISYHIAPAVQDTWIHQRRFEKPWPDS